MRRSRPIRERRDAQDHKIMLLAAIVAALVMASQPTEARDRASLFAFSLGTLARTCTCAPIVSSCNHGGFFGKHAGVARNALFGGTEEQAAGEIGDVIPEVGHWRGRDRR